MVDIAINVYGKPFQTAVALLSLLRHSGQHVGTIYFIVEKKQPHACSFDFLLEAIRDRVVVYRPSIFLWTYPMKYFRPLLKIKVVRESIRYQYAWEKSTSKYLFITHNDVLYKKDIIGHFLQNIGTHIAIGQVGMCWNCSAYAAGVCDGDRYFDFRPSADEYLSLKKKYPSLRNRVSQRFENINGAWPLPECRLNEWSCMINLDLARPCTMPTGEAVPFGTMMLDVGTEWFYRMHQIGHRVKNMELSEYAEHGWAGSAAGHSALFDEKLYAAGENRAKEFLAEKYELDI